MRFSKSSPDFERSERRRATVAAIALMLAAIGCADIGCRGPAPSGSGTAYQPFYSVPVATPDARGTVKGDYQWAASSKTLDEAAMRWREFLNKHLPPGGEYQDAFQRNYVRSAQYELMRAEYLLGRTHEGDALLRELEDVRGK
jgi:hypothetical protein